MPRIEQGKQERGPVSNLDLMARAARLHYEFGLTHEEAGEALSLSRVKVTRLLKQAREAGMVKITIITNARPFGELEERLVGDFGLTEAIVVPSGNGTEDRRRSVLAQGVASYLVRVVRDDLVVAVGLSRTIAKVPMWLDNPRRARATFVSIVGALSIGGAGSGNPYQATDAFATAFGGIAEHLHAPVIVRSAEVAEELRRDPGIAQTLEHAAAADVAFAGVGGRDDRISFAQGAGIPAAEWDDLLRAGMVGDIHANFFDGDGMTIDHDISRRVIGLSLEQFKKIPNRVVAAGGATKIKPLQAALRGGIITVLVTDAGTARSLLKLD
jgi:lsr operon transcriptional repressor